MTTTTHAPRPSRSWPRRRLQLRSIISAVLPVGWTWAAATALVPYFWADHGPGSSTSTVAGLSRATWIDLHVWSSIAMGLLTIGHVVLNRKGMMRSYRVLGGTSAGASERIPTTGARKRSFAWAPALGVAAIVTVGGFWFAGIDDGHGGTGRAATADQGDHVGEDGAGVGGERGGDGTAYRGGRSGG